MTSVSWHDPEEDDSSVPTLQWTGRTHFNFMAGQSRLRAVPVVVHLLPSDIAWFGKDPSLFDELKILLRDRVVSTTNNGDKDGEAPKSRKRARKQELCVQGDRLQFTYRYRKTLPRYTVLSYAEDHADPRGQSDETSLGSGGTRSNSSSTSNINAGSGPGFRYLPLSESTLLVWVYRFDVEDPYRPVPNEAALQFAPRPASNPSPSTAADKPLDVESVVQSSSTGGYGTKEGPRDVGLLAWLWASETRDTGSVGGGGGGVRQHFIGSAAWQGVSAKEQSRDVEGDDIQRAIALSLAAGPEGEGSGSGDQDMVDLLDDRGVEERKGAN